MLTREERELLSLIKSIKKGDETVFCQYKTITPGNNENIEINGVDLNEHTECIYKKEKQQTLRHARIQR